VKAARLGHVGGGTAELFNGDVIAGGDGLMKMHESVMTSGGLATMITKSVGRGTVHVPTGAARP